MVVPLPSVNGAPAAGVTDVGTGMTRCSLRLAIGTANAGAAGRAGLVDGVGAGDGAGPAGTAVRQPASAWASTAAAPCTRVGRTNLVMRLSFGFGGAGEATMSFRAERVRSTREVEKSRSSR
jgi:hypothetical protein